MSETQQVLGLNGDEAVAYAIKQSNVDVVAAYPITPQTIIVERFAEYVADGEVDTEFVTVESEHSALSACIGASAAGARVFTATAANGLALMHEMLYIASGLRLPIVMAIVNRALSAPINIHCDHSDTMGARDAGWVQIYAEDAQEAYDSVIQAFKIAEDHNVLLPVMVTLDGFQISHTLQNVSVLSDEAVLRFIGKKRDTMKVEVMGRQGKLMLYPDFPLTFGPLDLYDYYFEHKMHQVEAMRNAYAKVKEVNKEYSELSGRSYGDGLVEPYRVEGADVLIVCLGSTAGTAKYVVDMLRDKGVPVGCLRIRTFRPFPSNELKAILREVDVVGVMDRSLSFGAIGGPVFMELRSLMYDEDEKPIMIDYIYGLGGRDTPPALIESVVKELTGLKGKPAPRDAVRFIGVRK